MIKKAALMINKKIYLNLVLIIAGIVLTSSLVVAVNYKFTCRLGGCKISDCNSWTNDQIDQAPPCPAGYKDVGGYEEFDCDSEWGIGDGKWCEYGTGQWNKDKFVEGGEKCDVQSGDNPDCSCFVGAAQLREIRMCQEIVCGDGICDSGENCPNDAPVCSDRKCYEPTCTAGCGEKKVSNGGTDEACHDSIGCTGGYCVCDGNGNCIIGVSCGDSICNGDETPKSCAVDCCNPAYCEYKEECDTNPPSFSGADGCCGDDSFAFSDANNDEKPDEWTLSCYGASQCKLVADSFTGRGSLMIDNGGPDKTAYSKDLEIKQNKFILTSYYKSDNPATSNKCFNIDNQNFPAKIVLHEKKEDSSVIATHNIGISNTQDWLKLQQTFSSSSETKKIQIILQVCTHETFYFDDLKVIQAGDHGYVDSSKRYLCDYNDYDTELNWKWNDADDSLVGGDIHTLGNFDVVGKNKDSSGATHEWVACSSDGGSAIGIDYVNEGGSVGYGLSGGVYHEYLCYKDENDNHVFGECCYEGDSPKCRNKEKTGGKNYENGDSVVTNNLAYYCYKGIWISDLDGNEDACVNAGFEWTGNKCCGNLPSFDESYNEQQNLQTLGGCWGGYRIDKTKLVSEKNIAPNPTFIDNNGQLDSANWDIISGTPTLIKIPQSGELKIEDLQTNVEFEVRSKPVYIKSREPYSYKASSTVLCTSGKQQLQLKFWDKDENQVGDTSFIEPTSNNEETISVTATAPTQNAVTATVSFYSSTANTAICTFSDVSFISSYDNVINSEGVFYGCKTEATEVEDFDDDTTSVLNDLVTSLDYCNSVEDYFCSHKNVWSDETVKDDSNNPLPRTESKTVPIINLVENGGFEKEGNWYPMEKHEIVCDGGSLSPAPKLGDCYLKSTYTNSGGGAGRATLSSPIWLEASKTYILSGWIYNSMAGSTANAYLDLNDASYECSTASTRKNEWEFVYCEFTTPASMSPEAVVRAVTDGTITSGKAYFDNIQIEEKINEPAPFFYGYYPTECCPDNYCWDGTKCIEGKEQEALEDGDYYKYPDGSKAYACVSDGTDAKWELLYKKYIWRDYTNPQQLPSGFCKNEQCYGIVATQQIPRCIDNKGFGMDHYCENGIWTSRTQKIALSILNIKDWGDDYVISCDKQEKPFDDKDRPVCVLKSYDAIVVGTVLYSDEELTVLMDKFNIEGSVTPTPTGFANGFVPSTSTRRVKSFGWNEEAKIILFSNQPLTYSQIPFDSFDISTIWDTFPELKDYKDGVLTPPALIANYNINEEDEYGPETLNGLLDETVDFDDIFIRKTPAQVEGQKASDQQLKGQQTLSRWIRAIIEPRPNRGAAGSYNLYEGVFYDGFSLADDYNFCENVKDAYDNTYYDINYVGEANRNKHLYCKKEDDDYTIFTTVDPLVENNQYSAPYGSFLDKIWQDLTSKHKNNMYCAYEINPSYHISSAPAEIVSTFTKEYVLFNNPIKEGCCKEKECWSGFECIAHGNSMDYNNMHFVCQNGEWSPPLEEKFDWDNDYSGYCYDNTHCYCPDEVDGCPTDDESYQCVDSDFYYKDHYCLANLKQSQETSQWTTRTGLIATAFHRFVYDNAINDYALFCDDYTDVLNYYTDLQDNYLAPEAGNVNKLCVLRYNKDGEMVAFGTSLNPVIDNGGTPNDFSDDKETTVPDFIEKILKTQDATLDGKECNNVITIDGDYGTEKNKFRKCDYGNKLWLNNETRSLIYAKDGIDLTDVTWWDDFVNFLSNPVKAVIDYIKAHFSSQNYVIESPPADFDSYYAGYLSPPTMPPTKSAVGTIKDKADEQYMVTNYKNIKANVCKAINSYDNTNFKCCYDPNKKEFMVITKEVTNFNVWKELTSKLRMQPGDIHNVIEDVEICDESCGGGKRYIYYNQYAGTNCDDITDTVCVGKNDDIFDGLCSVNQYNCVFNGNGNYVTNSLEDIDNDGIIGEYCYSGKWRDCDSSTTACTNTCHYNWVEGGESSQFGEYDSGDSIECCGDDKEEFYVPKQGTTPAMCVSTIR